MDATIAARYPAGRRGPAAAGIWKRTFLRIAFAAGIAWAALGTAAAETHFSTREIARKILPSVVTIYTYDEDGKLEGNGSGFVVHADGLVLTNSHVIANADRAGVTFANGRSARIVGVVAADPDTDYALVKVEAAGLAPVRLWTGGEPEIGERVVAVGAPLGLTGTVSEGIVSQVRQQDRDGATSTARTMIQHTAAISPGNSGGPLVNDRLEVIGINTEQASRGQNLNFALPVYYAREALSGDLRVRQDLAGYRQELADREEQRALETLRKAFTVYRDPDGLLSFLSPKGWTVQRQVQPHADSGGTLVTVMVHAPEAEQAQLGGGLSEGMRFTLLLPPKGQVWTDAYRKQWATERVRSTVGSYDQLQASDPETMQLGNVTMVGVAYRGSPRQLARPGVGSLFVLAEAYLLASIELAMPAEHADLLLALATSTAASLEVNVED